MAARCEDCRCSITGNSNLCAYCSARREDVADLQAEVERLKQLVEEKDIELSGLYEDMAGASL